MRWREEDGQFKHDYFLSNAAADTPRRELIRAAKTEHRMEEIYNAARGECGLADYEVRLWGGWHHRQIPALEAGQYKLAETVPAELHQRWGRHFFPRGDTPELNQSNQHD